MAKHPYCITSSITPIFTFASKIVIQKLTVPFIMMSLLTIIPFSINFKTIKQDKTFKIQRCIFLSHKVVTSNPNYLDISVRFKKNSVNMPM